MTHIKSDGILKGNADIEDSAQEDLRKALLEKEMMTRFPEFFHNTIERSAP